MVPTPEFILTKPFENSRKEGLENSRNEGLEHSRKGGLENSKMEV